MRGDSKGEAIGVVNWELVWELVGEGLMEEHAVELALDEQEVGV
jgi:hypothetical protein